MGILECPKGADAMLASLSAPSGEHAREAERAEDITLFNLLCNR